MKWNKITDQLPPANTPVWVKRKPNIIEQVPIYIAMRRGNELSVNPDPSQNCYWEGIDVKSLSRQQDSSFRIEFQFSFSDVTVLEWAFIQSPLSDPSDQYEKLELVGEFNVSEGEE